jgi:hypothetical protein
MPRQGGGPPTALATAGKEVSRGASSTVHQTKDEAGPGPWLEWLLYVA